MVTVSNYALRVRKSDESTFVVLELTGGLEIIQSSSTGKFYASMRKANLPSTFSEEMAKTLIGQTLQGNIIKEEVEPYEFTNQKTGEIMMLNYSYAYQPEENAAPVGRTAITEMELA